MQIAMVHRWLVSPIALLRNKCSSCDHLSKLFWLASVGNLYYLSFSRNGNRIPMKQQYDNMKISHEDLYRLIHGNWAIHFLRPLTKVSTGYIYTPLVMLVQLHTEYVCHFCNVMSQVGLGARLNCSDGVHCCM